MSIEFTPGRIFGGVVAAGALGAGAFAIANHGDNVSAEMPSVESPASANNETTTTGTNPNTTTTSAEVVENTEDLIDNVFNNPNGTFECLDEGRATDTMRVVTLPDGEDTVGEVLLKNLKVDSTTRDDDHRLWTDAVSSPITVDLNDKKAVAMNLFATWCEQPAALAAALVETANSKINGITVGDRVDWLKSFVGTTTEEVNDVANSLTLPNAAAQLTKEQFQQNVDVNNLRIILAERMANAYLNLENRGVYLGAQIADSLGLDPVSAMNTETTPEFRRSGKYVGNVVLFGLTVKGQNCLTFNFGYNVDDQRPVIVITPEDCQPNETTTTQPGETTTTKPGNTTTTTNGTTTTGGNTTTSIHGKNDDGSLPCNNETQNCNEGGDNGDHAGDGDAGQQPGDNGTVPGETLPQPQTTTSTTEAKTTTTAAPATTGTQAPAPSQSVTTSTTPANSTTPPKPKN